MMAAILDYCWTNWEQILFVLGLLLGTRIGPETSDVTSHELAKQLLTEPDLPVRLTVHAGVEDSQGTVHDAFTGECHLLRVQDGAVRLYADDPDYDQGEDNS